MTDKTEVQYRCVGCGLTWTPVQVRYRDRGEDLMDWFSDARAAVTRDHASRSPLCASEVCDLKLPVTSGGEVGGRTLS